MGTLKRNIGICVIAVAIVLLSFAEASQASDFTKALTKDYFKLAQQQYYFAHDKFAVKARAADKGKNVLPDNPAKQKKLKGRWRPRLTEAHARLMAALNGGFRTQNPKQASRAQSSFDCWLWAVIEKDTKCIDKCRKRFLAAMKAWSPPMMKAKAKPKPKPVAKPKPKPVAKPKPKPAPPPPPRSFIVFFDWNASITRADSLRVINAAVAYAKRRGFSRVKLSGHADRSGKANYNMRLSQRRANWVKSALVKLGLAKGNILTVAHGEGSPLVATSDGVREPRNRRVEISF